MSIAEEFDISISIIEKNLEKSFRSIEIDSTSQHFNEETNYDLIVQDFSIDIDDVFNLHIQQNAQKIFDRLNANITKVNNNQDELNKKMNQIFSRRNKDIKTNNFTFKSVDIFDNAVEKLNFFDNFSFNLEENDHRDENNIIEQKNDEEKDANLYIVSDSI